MSSPSQKTADHWNRQLRYFRFHFAHGGHANDMDFLSAGIRFAPGEHGLLETFSQLRVELHRIPESMPRREPGHTYNSADWDRHADPIRAYPAFASPGFVSLLGIPANLSVSTDQIRIALSGAHGNHWIIDDLDFRNAQALESLLPQRGIRFVRIASRMQVEALFYALKKHQLADLRTYRVTRAELLSKGVIKADTVDAAMAGYANLREQLGSEFADDEVWQDSHDEIFALVQSALNDQANPHSVAHRCPGFVKEVIDQVCADVRFASR